MAERIASPEYQQYRDIYSQAGSNWGSKNAMSDLYRLLVAQQFPFMMSLGPIAQQNILSQMGEGLGMQDKFSNAALAEAENQRRQALAQGLPFSPADTSSLAGMMGNANTRDWIAGGPGRVSNAVGQGYGMFGNLAQGGSPYVRTPKQPGFFGQVAGAFGSALGQGWNPFGGRNPGVQPGGYEPGGMTGTGPGGFYVGTQTVNPWNGGDPNWWMKGP